jgi:hypothetical protein
VIRRSFLRQLVATAAGLLVADDALELLTEPRRRLWPGADFAPAPAPLTVLDMDAELRRIFAEYLVHKTDADMRLLAGLASEPHPIGRRYIETAQLFPLPA